MVISRRIFGCWSGPRGDHGPFGPPSCTHCTHPQTCTYRVQSFSTIFGLSFGRPYFMMGTCVHVVFTYETCGFQWKLQMSMWISRKTTDFNKIWSKSTGFIEICGCHQTLWFWPKDHLPRTIIPLCFKDCVKAVHCWNTLCNCFICCSN